MNLIYVTGNVSIRTGNGIIPPDYKAHNVPSWRISVPAADHSDGWARACERLTVSHGVGEYLVQAAS